MNYFISDLHIHHSNIIHYDNRPFVDIDEHDAFIMQKWNNRVKDDDDVYVLGDIGFANIDFIVDYYKQLKGKKHLIAGNHDKLYLNSQNIKKISEIFCEIDDYKELYIDRHHSIVLCHYPIPCFKNSFRGWFHFYGHVHNSFDWNMMEHDKMLIQNLYSKNEENKTDVCRMYNVGCMMPYINYEPKSFKEIIQSDGCKTSIKFI